MIAAGPIVSVGDACCWGAVMDCVVVGGEGAWPFVSFDDGSTAPLIVSAILNLGLCEIVYLLLSLSLSHYNIHFTSIRLS